MALSRRTISVTTVTVLLVALGGGIWWRIRSEGEPSGGAETAETTQGDESAEPKQDTTVADVPSALTFSADDPDPVEGAPALRDTLWIYVQASGTATAVSSDTVTALVPGVVAEVAVRENASVAAGDVLLQTDTTELALEVQARRADQLVAEAEFRILTMFDPPASPESPRTERTEVTRARSGLAQAEAALREAELQLERATVRAPFAGRVSDLEVDPGEQVEVGARLVTVMSADPIDVVADVLESAVPDLVEGRHAELHFAAFPGETFTGVIRSVNPVVSPTRRAARVVVRLRNPAGRIRPGMYARVALQARAYPDVVMVPRAAILERGVGERRTMLFVFEEGLAKWRYVTVGPENERYAAILPNEETDMVEPGEIVLVDGHHYMAHDTRVKLVESVFAAGGRPGR